MIPHTQGQSGCGQLLLSRQVQGRASNLDAELSYIEPVCPGGLAARARLVCLLSIMVSFAKLDSVVPTERETNVNQGRWQLVYTC